MNHEQPKRLRKRRGLRAFLENQSGQAMAETVIMCSALGFAWILCYFSLFMANNQIRNLSMVRHMAWMKGNELDAGAQITTVDAMFFEFTGFHTNRIAEGSMATGALSLGGGTAVGMILGWLTPSIWHCDLGFGITSMTDSNASKYPFYFMRTDFPFMPVSLLEDWLMMDSACEWEKLYVIWDGISF